MVGARAFAVLRLITRSNLFVSLNRQIGRALSPLLGKAAAPVYWVKKIFRSC